MLSDYNIVTILHEGPRTMVYRAVHAEGEKVIIKMLRARRPAPSEIARLEQELELTRALDIPDIVRVHDLVRSEQGYALIKEDMGGVSLESMAKAMDLDGFYDVAIPLTRALANLHEKNVIHRDINPRNVIFNARTNVLKLTDFGIASRLSPNQDHAPDPETVLGSLPYMSPEQTGRVNRALDARGDLYSVGVTFYEMLTGRLPFPGDDPAELVHSHLAREAPAPDGINPEIPGQLVAVIMKLLAKTAVWRPTGTTARPTTRSRTAGCRDRTSLRWANSSSPAPTRSTSASTWCPTVRARTRLRVSKCSSSLSRSFAGSRPHSPKPCVAWLRKSRKRNEKSHKKLIL